MKMVKESYLRSHRFILFFYFFFMRQNYMGYSLWSMPDEQSERMRVGESKKRIITRKIYSRKVWISSKPIDKNRLIYLDLVLSYIAPEILIFWESFSLFKSIHYNFFSFFLFWALNYHLFSVGFDKYFFFLLLNKKKIVGLFIWKASNDGRRKYSVCQTKL